MRATRRKHRIRTERLVPLLLILLCSPAGAALPPPFVITEPFESAPITVYSDYLVDTGNNLTLADIQRERMKPRFVPAANTVERRGLSDNTWWIRFALRNEMQRPYTRVLELTPGPAAAVTFYQQDNGKYHALPPDSPLGDTGARLHRQKRLYTLTLPPDETRTYYVRIQPEHSFRYSLHLSSHARQLENSLLQAATFWLLVGLTTGLVLYNLGLSLFTRDTKYLWYSLFLFLLVLAALSRTGVAPGGGHFQAMLVLAALAANIWFSRLFLDLPLMLPAVDRLLLRSSFALTGSAVLVWLLPPPMAVGLAYGLAAVLPPLLLWLGIYCWQRHIGEAGFYVAARAVLTVVTLAAGAAVLGWYALAIEFAPLVLGAAALEALLFAVGLHRQRERDLRLRLESRQHDRLNDAVRDVRHDTLARVSHEVRTPMSGILGMAEILDDTPLSPNQKEYVRAIRAAGENLLHVVGDVLMFSEEPDRRPNINRETFELTRSVMEALDLFRERAEEKEIELITHIHTNVPTHIQGDRARLRQVLTNLLASTIRHGEPGELMIDVSRDPSGRAGYLRFEFAGSSLQGAWNALSVLDNPEEQSPAHDSTALGLSIARQLVEAMGGRLLLRKDRQQHPLCQFSLPLPEAAGEEAAPPVDESILSGRNMLIVDDSTTVTRVIRQQALSWGMRVTVCHEPREALATIRTQANINEPFEVVLVDHQMPGINGMQLAARIHEDPVIMQPMALIMLTGVQAAPSATAARNVGVHRVLAKPVSGAQLRQAVAEELGQLARQPKRDPEEERPVDPELRLLVAEDHQLSQKVIRGMLSKLGLEADLVSNGREALEAVQANDYDLVLMDCEMPEMDGFEATRRIRTWEYSTHRSPVPIIALTAHIMREHRERSLAAGMNDHVPKPVELDVLRRVIARFTSGDDARPRD